MSEILLRRDEAEGIAQEITTAASDARERFTTTQNRLAELSESFRGAASTSFQGKFDEWKSGADQVVEALEGLGVWLKEAAEAIDSTDQQLASGLG